MQAQITPFSVIIPARYASTRLPGKPLLSLANKPMIQHVYEKAIQSQAEQVVIATDDERIFQCAQGFGADVVMTSPDHSSGTDRLQEVVTKLNLDSDDIVVNVQGDEPMIPPCLIDQVARNLASHPSAGIATLCEPIDEVETVFNPNAVKVVFDQQGFANYFSRAPIPWSRDCFSQEPPCLPSGVSYFRHIGIYAYRVAFLHRYVSWTDSQIEKTECLEQLRALSNGIRIHVDIALESPPAGIDTEEDLQRLRVLFD